MIKNITISILLCLMVISANAAKSGQNVKIQNAKVEKVGEQLCVRFTAEIPKNAVSRNYKLTLLPIISKDGLSKDMMPIVVESRRSQIIDYRNRVAPQYNIIHTSNGKMVEYEAVVPYQKWMNGSMLRIDRKLAGCCTENILQPELVAQNLKFVPEFSPVIEKSVALNPQVEKENIEWAFSKKEMMVYFIVNKTGIDQTLFDNRNNLSEIVTAVRQLNADRSREVEKIRIEGFASPEGSTTNNSRLAEGRATALRNYLQSEISGVQSSQFELQNGGENWNGLREMVAASDMQYRGEVLNIIDNVPVEIDYLTNTSRKKQLMDIKGGKPYTYMLENFYPKLRNACYISVYYRQLGDKNAETINRAISMIEKKEYNKALEILLPIKDDTRAWNSIGVCYMMTEKLSEAEVYLTKATNQGNKQATENLKQIVENK